MRLRKRRAQEHEQVMRQLDGTEARIVDFTARLVRLEAEIGVYQPKRFRQEERFSP